LTEAEFENEPDRRMRITREVHDLRRAGWSLYRLPDQLARRYPHPVPGDTESVAAVVCGDVDCVRQQASPLMKIRRHDDGTEILGLLPGWIWKDRWWELSEDAQLRVRRGGQARRRNRSMGAILTREEFSDVYALPSAVRCPDCGKLSRLDARVLGVADGAWLIERIINEAKVAAREA
jgi:hypothetical protein